MLQNLHASGSYTKKYSRPRGVSEVSQSISARGSGGACITRHGRIGETSRSAFVVGPGSLGMASSSISGMI